MVLRNGSLSPNSVAYAIKRSDKYKAVPVFSHSKHYAISEDIKASAPGQLVKHYAPDIETYLINFNQEFEVQKEK